MSSEKNSGISPFQRYLSLWVFLCMVAGVLVGHFLPSVPRFLDRLQIDGISIPIAILIWIMIYPMMMKVDFQSIREVGRHPKGLFVTWITNWLIKPFTMYALAAFVPIVKFLLGVSHVTVPYSVLFLSIFLFVVIPLAGGILTRMTVIRQKGEAYFNQVFIHKFDQATTWGLLLTLVIIFSSQAQVILSNPFHILLIAIPLVLQTYLIFAIAYGASNLLHLPHNIAAPAGMIGASNFFELAVAVAIALFGVTSPAALATTVGVLTEVPVMLSLVKIANK